MAKYRVILQFDHQPPWWAKLWHWLWRPDEDESFIFYRGLMHVVKRYGKHQLSSVRSLEPGEDIWFSDIDAFDQRLNKSK